MAALLGALCVANAASAADVTLENSSAWTIYELYLSPSSESTWGPDQLGNEVIGTGDEYELSGIPCDDYDVKLVDEDSDVCVLNGVHICGGSESWVITSDDLLACQGATSEGSSTFQGNTSVEIVNKSAWAIHYFYLSPVTDDSWGPDQLGAAEVISTGGSFELAGVPCDHYDVKLVDEDGDECVVNAVDICGDDGNSWVIDSADLLACQGSTGSGTGSAQYQPGDTNIKVVNQSAWAIHYFYLSPVSDDEWGPDQLGAAQVIGTGDDFELTGVPCGSYDVKLVDEDGDECVVNAVNICEGSAEWVITSEDLLACQAG